jgi:hypothetical protein
MRAVSEFEVREAGITPERDTMTGLLGTIAGRRGWWLLSIAGLLAASAEIAVADDPFAGKTIVRVEEDWLVDVGLADDVNSAPEIVTVFGPSNPLYGTHAVFEMNHSTQPEFIRGGMQIQCWYGDWYLGGKRHFNSAEMQTVVERIKFTCVTSLNVDGARYKLEIKNGDSVTYGSFGGDGSLTLNVSTLATSLNNYDPNSSITHSRVTFGANRVNRYLRSEIRYYASDGTVVTDPVDRVVHQLVEAELGPAPINE